MLGQISRGSSPSTSTPPPASQPGSFPSRNESAPGRSGGSGVLSKDVSIKGDVTFKNELVIDCQVEGTIKSSGSLTIGENARIKADIDVGSVTVYGSVNGNITATDRCALEPGASVQGDISAPRLALNENATFLGRATISSKKA